MSALDLDLGRCAYDQVNHLRQKHGRWGLQEDGKIAQEAFAHIIHGIKQRGLCHADNAFLSGVVENVHCGTTHDPYSLIQHFIQHSDNCHRGNYMREDIDAQGLAVHTEWIECRWRYWTVLVWRGRFRG